jgi:23S rRNA (cytidine1920-2'-O)/16S rRNA (cytidine1409-2'-O)-methyltransferase
VTVLEQLSARLLAPAHIGRPATWVVCDASFIGLRKVLEVPLRLAARPTRLVALIKPQFEAGPDHVGKGGLVKDPEILSRVQCEVAHFLDTVGWAVQALTDSPISGGAGQAEFLIHAVKHP